MKNGDGVRLLARIRLKVGQKPRYFLWHSIIDIAHFSLEGVKIS